MQCLCHGKNCPAMRIDAGQRLGCAAVHRAIEKRYSVTAAKALVLRDKPRWELFQDMEAMNRPFHFRVFRVASAHQPPRSPDRRKSTVRSERCAFAALSPPRAHVLAVFKACCARVCARIFCSVFSRQCALRTRAIDKAQGSDANKTLRGPKRDLPDRAVRCS